MLLVFCEGNPPVSDEFLPKSPWWLHMSWCQVGINPSNKYYQGLTLTDWGRDKVAAIFQRTSIFLNENM